MSAEEQVRRLTRALKAVALNTYIDARPSKAVIDIRYIAEEALIEVAKQEIKW